jgi:hypothetical protein
MKLIIKRESLGGVMDDTQHQPWPGTRIENVKEYEGLTLTTCDWVMDVEKFADIEQFIEDGNEVIITPRVDGATTIEIMDLWSVQELTDVI